jgi:hypothetical protein
MSVRSLVVALCVLATSAPAAAQVVIQGEVSIQPVPAPPTVVVAPPTPQPYVQTPAYVEPAYVQAPAVAPQCPPGAVPSADRWGRPVCMAEVTRHRVNGGMLGAGIGMFAGGYVLQIISSVVSATTFVISDALDVGYPRANYDAYVDWGWVPILGPWVQMGYLPSYVDTGYYAWLAFEGLLEAGGIVLAVFGIIGEDYTDYRPIAGLDLSVRPLLGQNAQGVSATLRF